jgi:hypothetical protein
MMGAGKDPKNRLKSLVKYRACPLWKNIEKKKLVMTDADRKEDRHDSKNKNVSEHSEERPSDGWIINKLKELDELKTRCCGSCDWFSEIDICGRVDIAMNRNDYCSRWEEKDE